MLGRLKEPTTYLGLGLAAFTGPAALPLLLGQAQQVASDGSGGGAIAAGLGVLAMLMREKGGR